MNHQKVYDSIIQKAKSENRIKLRKNQEGYIYYENHHIIPSCLNGTNDKENLVLLTAREHFVCHKLLTYIYKGNKRLALAYHKMTYSKNGNYNKSSRDYLYARELASTINSGKNHFMWGKNHSNESIEKMKKPHKKYDKDYINKLKEMRKGEKNPMAGKKHSDETKEKMRKIKLGKHHSEESKKKMSETRKGKTFHTEEFKKQISEMFKGKTYEEIYGKKKADEIKQKLKSPKTEEHKIKLSKPRNFSWVCNKNLNIEFTVKKHELEIFLKINTEFFHGRLPLNKQKRRT